MSHTHELVLPIILYLNDTKIPIGSLFPYFETNPETFRRVHFSMNKRSLLANNSWEGVMKEVMLSSKLHEDPF